MKIRNRVMLLSLVVMQLYAADGTLDTSFGGTGIVQTDASISMFHTVVVRYDGMIVAGGACAVGVGLNPVLAIFNSDGTLAGSPNCLTTTMGTDSEIYGLAVQPDNKVVAAMQFDTHFAIARFNTDGSLDTDFGTNGITQIATSMTGEATAVAFRKDGSIVASGVITDSTLMYAVASFNADGTPDANFASGAGYSTYNPTGQAINTSRAENVAIQILNGTEYILFCGEQLQNGLNKFQIVRLTSNGVVDLSFGGSGNGTAQIPFSGLNAIAHDLAVYPDGRIAVVGASPTFRVLVALLQSNGTLDTSFGGTGMVTYNGLNAVDEGLSVVLQNDGKIVVGGFENVDGTMIMSFLLFRLNTDGSFDHTFGTLGIVLTTFTTALAHVNGLALQLDGKIVAVGPATNLGTIARYLNNNTTDQVIVTPTIDTPTNVSNVNTPFPLFRGIAQNPANITIYIDDVEVGRTITQGSANTWQFVPTVPLSQGKHSVRVVAEYKSGNQNAIATECIGICLGAQSCLSEAVRAKYCPSCVDVALSF